MIKRRQWLKGAGGLMMAGWLGCDRAPWRSKAGDVVRVAISGEPTTLDPNRAYDALSSVLLMQLHEGLTRHDAALNAQPALAESWRFDDDLRAITFTLRANLRWSDGVPITAHHFEASWLRLLDPRTRAEYAYFLFDVTQARAFNAGEARAEEVGVKALDARTLRVTLEGPAPYFPHLTAFMILYPIRPDRIAALGDRWTEPGQAVTSGAFVPTSHRRDYCWTLERNPHDPLRDRSQQQQGVERVELYCIPEKSTALNLFMTGELDMVLEFLPLAIPSMRAHPGYATAPKLEVRYVAFRLDQGPTRERLLRQALAQALDRSELPRVLRGGQLPTTSWLPPGMFGHDPTAGLPFDPQAARAALADSRHASEGAGAAPLRLLLRSGDDWRLMGENVQEQWRRALGLSIPLEVREQRVFFQELASDAAPPMHLARWVADFPDPENFMGMFRSDSGHNTLRLKSERYDALVSQAVLTADSGERARLYSQAQRELLVEEVAMAPLYVNAQNHLIDPALTGVELNAMGDLSLRRASWRERGGRS